VLHYASDCKGAEKYTEVADACTNVLFRVFAVVVTIVSMLYSQSVALQGHA
jgi:hypothetical protein